TIITGATQLRSFTDEGGHWVALLNLDHTNPICDAGPCTCVAGVSACNLTEDLFFDDRVFQRVSSLSAVSTGKWYWNRSTEAIYLADTPAGHDVETSTASEAFVGSAGSVTINGLVIKRFAGEAIRASSANGQDGKNWVVENCNIQGAHLAGISTGTEMKIVNNTLCDNGKLGIIGNGDSDLVQGNIICRNNYAGFYAESGGAYFSATSNLVVRSNYVYNNHSIGLHTDGSCENTLYDSNHTAGNNGAGIVHEISHAAIIRNNVSENDVFVSSHSSAGFGSGIWILASDNVEVYGNTVTNSMNGITAYQAYRYDTSGVHLLENLWVHDNVITQQKGAAGGILVYTKAQYYPAVFTTMNNHFDNNTYCIGSSSGNYFDWQLGTVSMEVWQKTYGQDVHSTIACPAK
ncbi:MAG: right-handed parallel beta-helix repeat-containing protein, partial [Blastocatellia bacterium]